MRWIGVTVLVMAATAVAATGEAVKWSATDTAGKAVTVPVADKPTVLLFVRGGDHAPSAQAIEQIGKLQADKAAQVIVVFTGKQADEHAKAAGNLAWPVVVDPDYAASGRMNVHVWPTTVIVRTDGQELAHVAGMPKSYATDVEAYLAHAAGKLDETALKQKLATRQAVTDSPREKAARHVQIAHRLLAQGKVPQARAEVDEAAKLSPDDPAVQLMLARVLVQSNQPAEALALLDKLPKNDGPAWPAVLVRARALIALEKWDQAKAILPDAVKLNPDPAEAHYLMGLVAQHNNDPAQAAESFRKAYESAQARP